MARWSDSLSTTAPVILFCMILPLLRFVCAGNLPSPSPSVSVVSVSMTSATVCWSSFPETMNVSKYEITYHPKNARYKIITEVPRDQRSTVLEKLLPRTKYELYITAVNDHGRSNKSNIAEFYTIYPDQAHKTGTFYVRTEEIVIILVILLLWAGVIGLFFNKWGKIHVLAPIESHVPNTNTRSKASIGSINHHIYHPPSSIGDHVTINTPMIVCSSAPNIHQLCNEDSSPVFIYGKGMGRLRGSDTRLSMCSLNICCESSSNYLQTTSM